jgi:hypothetical protein
VLEKIGEVDWSGRLRVESFDAEYPGLESLVSDWRDYLKERPSSPLFEEKRDEYYRHYKPYFAWKEAHEFDLPT